MIVSKKIVKKLTEKLIMNISLVFKQSLKAWKCTDEILMMPTLIGLIKMHTIIPKAITKIMQRDVIIKWIKKLRWDFQKCLFTTKEEKKN